MSGHDGDQMAATDPRGTRRPLWQAVIGIRRRSGRIVRYRPTAWGLMLWGGVAFIALGIGFAEYSMQPDFCRTCHIMEPYYQAWHESTHRDVPCGDCHFEPGWRHTLRGKFEASSQAVKYITGTYGSKPHAEVRDASCLRSGCHDQRMMNGLTEWEVPTQRGQTIKIHFDHGPHLGELRRGKQLRCVSCHSQMVQGQHIVVTLDTCFTCHFKGMKHGRDEEALAGCGSCHGAPKDEIRLPTGVFMHAEYLGRGVACENCHSDVIKGDGEVPRQLCWTCHNQAVQVARYDETGFIHDKHVTESKVECSSCHVQIEHHLSAAISRQERIQGIYHSLSNTGTCGNCHEQSHNGPLEMYRGVGGRGVADFPSPMYVAQVDCIACHQSRMYPSETATLMGQTYAGAQERCNYCHGNRYDGVLDEWTEEIERRMQEAEVAGESVRQALDRAELDPERSLNVRRLIDDADYNIRFVRLGRGVHNASYATQLLSVAREFYEQALEQINVAGDEDGT